MMKPLLDQPCEACRADSARVTEEQIRRYEPEIPAWEIREKAGVPQLERVFSFPDFVSALAFTNRVGALAEAEGHHPAIRTEWGKVTVSWWTHKIKGLHRNDFILARKTDALLS